MRMKISAISDRIINGDRITEDEALVLSETVGGDVVYKVTIDFDSQPEGLRWGMSAEVKIETK